MANKIQSDTLQSSNNNICYPIKTLSGLVDILWGKQIQSSIFQRWCQGFIFSQYEPSALIQYEGGPCAVITAVQANILLELLFAREANTENPWSQLNDEEINQLLVAAISRIFKSLQVNRYVIIALSKDHLDNESSPDQNILNIEDIHSNLRQWIFDDIEVLKVWIQDQLQLFRDSFGILSLLYSILMTKGLENIQSEREDLMEPLIDPTFGHASQNLINLMITGRAVGNVWDNTRDIDGLVLFGIQRQPQIGFLSLMEHLRYCEVGSFMKNPANPIWILSSAEHLTVLFSNDRSLACIENPRDVATRCFLKYDQTENSFIASENLGKILKELGLETDVEYVTFMVKCLDKDNLGIILLKDFLNEFFPQVQDDPNLVKNFTLYHYNGLQKSNKDSKVVYNKFTAITLAEDDNIKDSNEEQIIQCLRTKWRNLSKLEACNGYPSLN